MAHAIDKDKIVDEILAGQVEPMSSYVDAFNPTLSHANWDQYNYDPAMSQQYIAALCEEEGVDCVTTPPKAVFTTTSNNATRRVLSELFVQMFDDAGILYEPQLEDSSLFFGETLDFGNWDLGEWAWVGSPGYFGLVGIHDVFNPEGHLRSDRTPTAGAPRKSRARILMDSTGRPGYRGREHGAVHRAPDPDEQQRGHSVAGHVPRGGGGHPG